MSLAWHPTENIFCFATTDGEVYIYPDFVSAEHQPLLQKPLQPAPYIHDPLAEVSANARRPPPPAQAQARAEEAAAPPRRKRARTPDSLDDILGSEDDDDGLGGFIIDDDGAGYVDDRNGYGKRNRDEFNGLDGPAGKRRATYQAWEPQLHEPFQPGSTPWRGNRRYLCEQLTRSTRTSLTDSPGRSEPSGMCLERRSGHPSHRDGGVLRPGVSSRFSLHRSVPLRQGVSE